MTIYTWQVSHESVLEKANREQLGDAELFAELLRGNVLYDTGELEWYLWNGNYWVKDDSGQVWNLVGNQLSGRYEMAAGVERSLVVSADDEHYLLADMLSKRAHDLRKRGYAGSVLKYASNQQGLVIASNAWDYNPLLLGVANGTLELSSSTLRPSLPSDYIRSIAPTEYRGEKAPRFERFLNEIFDGDSELIAFIQRLLGYSISGLNKEHVFPILIGQGRNGKSLLIETIRYVLGRDLAGPVPAEVLLDSGKNPNAASPHLLELKDRRLAFVSEINEGYLNSAQLKQLTGGDMMTARPLYGKNVKFIPKHKIFLVSNVRPYANADDYALWQRILVIEFPLSFVDDPQAPNERKVNRNLSEELRQEASGILAWLVQGFLDWQHLGLNPPESVKMAVAEYRKSEDTIAQFLSDEMELGEDKEIKSSMLYTYYEAWAKANGIRYPLGSRKFSQKMALRFEKDESRSDANYFIGLEPKVYVLDFKEEEQRQNLEQKNSERNKK